jgi:hypothetical protein
MPPKSKAKPRRSSVPADGQIVNAILAAVRLGDKEQPVPPKAKPRRRTPNRSDPVLALALPAEVRADLDVLVKLEHERAGGNIARLKGPVIRRLIREARRASGR